MNLLKRPVRTPVVVLVISIVLLVAILVGAVRYRAMSSDPGYGNLYSRYLTEPFETVLFVFVDGNIYGLTSHDSDGVRAAPGALMEALEKVGGVKNIAICVHNHMEPSAFSETDRAFYEDLKDHGFRGVFAVYCHLAKQVWVMTDMGWGQR